MRRARPAQAVSLLRIRQRLLINQIREFNITVNDYK